MQLTIVRHAETIENAERRLQGYQSEGILTARGKQQAQAAAELLKGERYDAIYSSDAKRCVKTTEYIAQYHAGVPVHHTEALREIQAGKIEGMSIRRVPTFIREMGVYVISRLNLRVPGGESPAELRTRVATFLNELYEKYPNGNVLIVTHGVTMHAIRAVVAGDIRITFKEVPNCTVWHEKMMEQVS